MAANKELDRIARRALAAAKAKGASQALAKVAVSREFVVRFRNGEIERLTESASRTLTLNVYVDGRFLSATTSDLREGGLAKFSAQAVATCRLLDADPDRSLPDAEAMKDPVTADLAHYDPSAAGGKEAKVALARQAEAAARAANAEIVQAESEYAENEVEEVLHTSTGFEGRDRSSSFSLEASAFAKDGETKKAEGWDLRNQVRLDGLGDPAVIGREAAKRALESRGAGPEATGIYDVVVDNRTASRLLRFLVAPLSGGSIHQNRSFLAGRIGQKVAAECLTFVDDPLLAGGLGSRPYDGEGIPSRRRPIIEAGVLRNFYLSAYYARKLKMRPTTLMPSNILVTPGTRSQDEVVAGLERGIFVTRFLGGNSNGLTGDFSTGVSGFLIEKGRLGRPITEMNMAGKLGDLLSGLAEVCNDPFRQGTWRTPTLHFAKVSVSGR